jgi:Sigma-70 region 2
VFAAEGAGGTHGRTYAEWLPLPWGERGSGVSTPDDSLQRFAFGPRGWGMRNEDGAIYAEVSAHLIRYAAVLVGPDEADDVVSNVMVRLLRRRSLSSLEDPRAYLFRSVLNESRGVLRSRRRPSSSVRRRVGHEPRAGLGGGRGGGGPPGTSTRRRIPPVLGGSSG